MPKTPTVTVVCGATIDGPKIGRRVVAWRKWCRRKVKVPVGASYPERYCWQHR